MDKDDDKKLTPIEAMLKVRDGWTKAMATLKRRGMMDQETLDVISTPMEFAYRKVKDHDCPDGVTVLMAVGKRLSEVAAALSMFEDHITEDHKEDEAKSAPTPELVTERKDNVIHVDLSKGRKN